MARTTAAKLQIKPGQELLFVGEPSHHALLGALPEGVQSVEDATQGTTGVAVPFTQDRRALDDHLSSRLRRLNDARAVWIAYPKGNRTDINRDSIWRRAEEVGWTATANVALDEVWSAVRIKPAR